MPYLQDLIHRLEVGPWFRHSRVVLSCLAVVALVVGYNWRSYRNMGNQEAMDAAQVGRNLAEGKGYTTLFIRPVSLHLVKERNEARVAALSPEERSNPARLKTMHPDLANPPVYPCVLAGVMKVLPFRYPVDSRHPFWSVPSIKPTAEAPRQFWRYQPDFLISLFNQVLFFGVIGLTFFLTRRLFDRAVAWTSAVLLLGCELLWRFSVSGLSTMLLLLIFTLLIWCLVLIEEEGRAAVESRRQFLLAAVAGLLLGGATLTRYAFGWVLVPVLVFLILFAGRRRAALGLIVFGVFLVVLAPWVYRNWSVSGLPFGTATYAVMEGTAYFPENRLARSLAPDFSSVSLTPFVHKLFANTRQLLQNDVPKLGGSWATSFFLVGLLLGFRNLAIRRRRYFLMGTLGLFVIVQALGRTQLSEDSPEVNSENLLVLLAPLVLVYGVSMFYLLLDQMNLLFAGLRYLVVGIFAAIVCLPLVFTFLPPKSMPLRYPPYYPPIIQQTAGWMKETELMMSDVPWAVAWYGQRQCIWLTLNAQDDFFAVNDLLKPIRGLYLTRQTMDSRFSSLLSEWALPAHRQSWGRFILESTTRNEVPRNFPLRESPSGFLPEQLFLSDWVRWKQSPSPRPPEK